MNIVKRLLEPGGIKRDITFLVLGGLSLAVYLFSPVSFAINPAWIAIVLCGLPIVLEAVVGLVTEFDITADVLVSLALIASVCIGEYFAAGEVAFIMQIGSLLEELTVARAQAGIESLVRLTPQTARVVRDGEETIVPAERVLVDDRLRVLPGETIPADGVIVEGSSAVDQSVLTGESLPVDKSVGDEVFSGTINRFGSFELRVTRAGEDSSIQRMVRLVQSADAGKAKIVNLADRWATWIVIAALTMAVLTWIITGEILRAVTILVVFCPCSLVLATPTAIVAAIGNATRHGILVREGDALERLAAVRRVAFDKAGTLTYGTPRVTAVYCSEPERTEQELFSIAAAAEQLSEHPLGKAVVNGWKECGGELLPAEDFEMQPGYGISAQVDGKKVLAGNRRMLERQGIAVENTAEQAAEQYRGQGCTVIYLAVNGRLWGVLALADTVRADSAETIRGIRALGIRPVLLTGDHANAAGEIARQLSIEEMHADCLPEDKLNWIAESQEHGRQVCMIGDGINDAPALKAARVGIALGGVGSDIAVDAADIALVNDEMKELPHLLSLSRRMMSVIQINLSFSMGLNILAVILAMVGVINPVIGALVHNSGSVLVILHSALLLRWKEKKQINSKNPTGRCLWDFILL